MSYESKNMAFSNISSTGTDYGITHTVNAFESSVVLDGTCTGDGVIVFMSGFRLPAGTYTASVLGLNSGDRLQVGKTGGGTTFVNYVQTNNPQTFMVTEETECNIRLISKVGSTYNNTEIKIQIEHGSVATNYEPHFEGFRSAKVTEIEIVGKNIFDSENAVDLGGSNMDVVRLENGIRVTAITDGSYKYRTFLVTDDITQLKGKTLFASSDMIVHNTDGRGYFNFITLNDENKTVDSSSVIDNGTISGKMISKLDIPANTSATKLVIRCYATYASGVTGDYVDFTNIQVEVSNAYTKYAPYTKTILPISIDVQDVDGYGESNPDNHEESNYFDFEKKQFVRFGHILDGKVWVPRDHIEIEDLSNVLTDDNLIQVEGGGTITAVNEQKKSVPSTITYMVRGEIL